MNDKINIKEKFKLFDTTWTPKILGEVNGFYIKIFKAKGEFVWHHHEHEDEFFLVISGELYIKMKDKFKKDYLMRSMKLIMQNSFLADLVKRTGQGNNFAEMHKLFIK